MNRKLFKESISDIKRYKLTFVVNFILVSFLVFLLCYLGFVILNINNVEKKFLQKNQLILFLNDKTDIDDFVKNVQSSLLINSVEIIDNDYLNSVIKKSFPTSELVSKSDYNVKIVRIETNYKNIKPLKEEFSKNLNVDDIIFNSEWNETFLNTLGVLRTFSFVIFIFLVTISSILFFYSYALFSAERVKEIQILKFLGATRFYIMLPYLLSSFIISVSGSLLGFFLYFSSISMLDASIKTFLTSWSNNFYLLNLSKFHFFIIFILISLSVFFSSLISLLKVVNEDT